MAIDEQGLRTALSDVVLGPEAEDDGSSAFLTSLAGDVPGVAFHYTSAAALHSILSTKTLRASHSAYLNDTTEIQHGLERCRARLRARLSGPRMHFTSTALRVLDAVFGEEQRFDIFVACFCDDADVIPQWRGYGAHGAGYALGLDIVQSAVASDTAPLRVIYAPEEQDFVLDAAIDGYLGVLERSLDAHPNETDATARVVGYSLVTLLTQLLAALKSDLFAYEREWRLVEFIYRSNREKQQRIKFREGGGVIVPYIDLPIESGDVPMPLKEIRCGPMAREDLAVAGVERFVASLGLTCPVTRSKAPLRF